MSYVIAVAGKGGTGKTTISSMVIRSLIKRGHTPVLAIDADPNSNLAESLGLDVEDTIGGVLADFLKERSSIPQGMTRQAYLDLKLHEIVKEGKDLDMLVMGCPEGPGCYCSANSMLKSYYEELAGNYKFVVFDNEAGMEHLSRKTTNKIDLLLFVTNYSLKGLKTVKRLSDMVDDLKIEVNKRFVVVNRTPEKLDNDFIGEIEKIEIPYLGNIVLDKLVEEADIKGTSIAGIPESSEAVKKVDEMLGNIIH